MNADATRPCGSSSKPSGIVSALGAPPGVVLEASAGGAIIDSNRHPEEEARAPVVGGAPDVLPLRAQGCALCEASLRELTARTAELAETQRELGREHERLLSALAEEEKAKNAAKRTAHQLALLKGISELALASREPTVVLEEILQRLRQDLPADSAVLLLREHDGDLRRVRVEQGRGGDGEKPTGSSAAVPLTQGGRVLGVLQVSAAERRPFDSEIQLLEDVAARLVAVLDRQRLLEAERQARAQAEAAVRQRDEVLAIVAHDLRNPLNRISLSASVLRTSPGARANPQPWDLIQRGVRDMDRLIQDLLDVSRMEAGALQVDRSDLPVAPLLAELQEQFVELARSRGVTLACRSDPAVHEVLADRGRLLQALANLVDNALRLTPPGGTVRAEALPGPGCVEFAVRDTGPGVPAEQLPHLFDRFWQGARARRGGAGLGLAIVKGIVEAHGGRVVAESSPGEGATFRFRIAAPA